MKPQRSFLAAASGSTQRSGELLLCCDPKHRNLQPNINIGILRGAYYHLLSLKIVTGWFA